MKKKSLLLFFLALAASGFAQRAYYWQGSASGAWSAAASWNTFRAGTIGSSVLTSTAVTSVTLVVTPVGYTSAPSVTFTG